MNRFLNLLIAVGVLGVVASVFVGSTQNQKIANVPTTTPTTSTILTETLIPAYRNEKYGFEITLPKNWQDYRVLEKPQIVECSYCPISAFLFQLPVEGSGGFDYKSAFDILIYSPSAWAEVDKAETSRPLFLARNDTLVFAWTKVNTHFFPQLDFGFLSTFRFIEPLVAGTWSKLIPVLGSILKQAFPEEGVGELYPLRVVEEADVTGDGASEAIIYLGTGGAYTDLVTLMMLENNNPAAVRFKNKEGKLSFLTFPNGSSVMHGSAFGFLPDKKAVYHHRWSFAYSESDQSTKLESCNVDVYRWNASANFFEYTATLSKEIGEEYCANVREHL